jgi:O-antigen ligase
MCAVILGQQFGGRPGAVKIMAKAFTIMLLLAVPAQLISTLAYDLNILSPSLFFFSAYQHLQYIPVIFVGAFLIAIFALWKSPLYRLPLLIITALMSMYVSLSLSILAIGLLISGLAFLAAHIILLHKKWSHALTIVLSAFISLSFSTTLINPELLREKTGLNTLQRDTPRTDKSNNTTDKVMLNTLPEASPEPQEIQRTTDEKVIEMPKNFTDRSTYLKFYAIEIAQNSSTLFLGHHEPPDRNSYPSAHNYYLDFIYNFGVLAIIPILSLIGFTAYAIFRNFSRILSSSETVGIAGVVLFLLLADNMLKVGMRQPYPGVMTFYLWGVLIALLTRLNKCTDGQPNA